jgi:hypothetical protein
MIEREEASTLENSHITKLTICTTKTTRIPVTTITTRKMSSNASTSPSVLSRTASQDSIPEVDFIGVVESQLKEMTLEVSEFKKKELAGELEPEPLLADDPTRFVLFPIKHNDVSTT